MCASDELFVLAKGREVAEELLRGLGVPLGKAIDVSTPGGFDRAVARFAAALRQAAALPEAEAVRRAVATLDVDWRALPPARRRELVVAALKAAGRALRPIPGRIEAPLGRMAAEVVSATRSHARRRQRLAIAAEFNAMDKRAVAHVRRSQVLYVTDEYGRRLASFEQRARAIVAEGLEQGLGRADIAEDLAKAAQKQLVGRSRSYWELVASAFVGEARALSQVSAFAEAGIERYVLHAVLDEHTCFPAGTLIETRGGDVPIERILPGFLVRTHAGRWRAVTAVQACSRRRAAIGMRTRLGGVVATTNHPFLVRRDGRFVWLRADELVSGDRLLRRRSDGLVDVRAMREDL